jgi:hypothetical protein
MVAKLNLKETNVYERLRPQNPISRVRLQLWFEGAPPSYERL